MVCLVDLNNPSVRYEGRIFWDMLRPGVRLGVYGPRGCTTTLIRQVDGVGPDRFVVHTRNTRYLLTKEVPASSAEIEAHRAVAA